MTVLLFGRLQFADLAHHPLPAGGEQVDIARHPFYAGYSVFDVRSGRADRQRDSYQAPIGARHNFL